MASWVREAVYDHEPWSTVPLPFGSDVAVAGSAFTAATPALRPASATFSARFTCRSRPKWCSLELTSVITAAVPMVRTPITIRVSTNAMPSCPTSLARINARRRAPRVGSVVGSASLPRPML